MILLHRSYQVGASEKRLSVVALVCSLLSGCAMQTATSQDELPSVSSDFRSRLYAGASFGSSRLSPSSTFDIEQANAMGTQLRFGYDAHERVAVELDTSILGDSQLRAAQGDVSYTSASVSALIYGLSGVQIRSRREGLSAYARVGYGSLRKSAEVSDLESSDGVPIFGVGAEYGLRGGLGLRAEITRFDSDVLYTGFGAVYRFGLSSTGIGRILAQPGEPSLGAANSAASAYSNTPVSALTMADRWRPAMRIGDADSDGVLDAQDNCPDTTTHVTVDRNGCGLFDAVLSDVQFSSGSSLLSAAARVQLDGVAETLLAFPESRVQVRAHTDSQGSKNLNQALSTERAEVVTQYLKSRGVHVRQLQAVGMGESQPMVSNSTPAGRQRNRRVDVVTLPDQDAGELPELVAQAQARVFVVSDPRQRDSSRDSAGSSTENAPSLQSAMPVQKPERSKLAIMPLPEPGFAPGVSISGIVEGVIFPSGSSDLSASTQKALENVIATMRNNPDVNIAIMAHTDDSGDAEENLALSKQRAESVTAYLVEQGITANRLEAEGYGEMLPLVQNVTDADRATNRRVEIRILRTR